MTTTLPTLTKDSPAGYYADKDGDLWRVHPEDGGLLFAHDQRWDDNGPADLAPVEFGPYTYVTLTPTELPTPPLPPTPGSLVEKDGVRYVAVANLAGATFRNVSDGYDIRTDDELAGATVLFDAATLDKEADR